LGKVSIAVKTFGVCDFSHLAVTGWRLLRWRLWFSALMTATQSIAYPYMDSQKMRGKFEAELQSVFTETEGDFVGQPDLQNLIPGVLSFSK